MNGQDTVKVEKFVPGTKITIRRIDLEGNSKTKPSIVLREMVLHSGDTISYENLDSLLVQSRKNIRNTNLFLSVDIDTFYLGQTLDLKVALHERWYSWPNIFVELADRNLNEWLQTKDFSRITLGMYFNQENFRGRSERVYFLFKFFYTQQFGIGYNIPYINKKKKSGLGFSVSHSRWHEATYKTLDNKLKFFKNPEEFMRREWNASVSYVYRPKLYNSHTATLEYKYNEIHDTVAKLNPDYFIGGRTKQTYVRLSYKVKRDKRDVTDYPLHGYYFDCEFVPTLIAPWESPRLLFWTLPTFKQFFELAPRLYFAYALRAKYSLGDRQPYFNERGLGFSNIYVRSYELYVVDGQYYAMYRSNLKYNFLKTKIFHFDKIRITKFNKIPVAMYANLFYDMGFVFDMQNARSNPLGNTFLYGYGIGIDYVTYYSIVLRGEYSINRMGERGFFVHFTVPI